MKTVYYQSTKPTQAEPTTIDMLKVLIFVGSILFISVVLFTKAIPSFLELFR
jgi:hypothetical protein